MTYDLKAFFAGFQEIFDEKDRSSAAASRLQSLRQGKRPATEYISEFRQVAIDITWNDSSLMHYFYVGLSGAIKDELARMDRPKTLAEAVCSNDCTHR